MLHSCTGSLQQRRSSAIVIAHPGCVAIAPGRIPAPPGGFYLCVSAIRCLPSGSQIFPFSSQFTWGPGEHTRNHPVPFGISRIGWSACDQLDRLDIAASQKINKKTFVTILVSWWDVAFLSFFRVTYIVTYISQDAFPVFPSPRQVETQNPQRLSSWRIAWRKNFLSCPSGMPRRLGKDAIRSWCSYHVGNGTWPKGFTMLYCKDLQRLQKLIYQL